MDSTLVGVTLLSMAMAISLSVVVWRLLRTERQRSDARVLALTEMAARSDRAPAGARPALRRQAAPDLPLRGAEATHASGALFSEVVAASPWPRRLAVIAALALGATTAILLALTWSGTHRAAAGASPSVAPPAHALELLSLRDRREPGTLTISGLVQNPRGAGALTRVTATAFTFDRTGGFLASGSAPLDFTTLQPGDESPFVVTVPVSDEVARYRISFRGEDGHVIAHVDRRQQPLARAES